MLVTHMVTLFSIISLLNDYSHQHLMLRLLQTRNNKLQWYVFP